MSTFKRVVLFLFFFGAAGAARGEAVVRTLEGRWVAGLSSRVWVEPGGMALIRSFSLDKAKPLLIRGEDVSVFHFHEGGSVQTGDGKTSLHSPDRVELFLNVQEAGTWHVWYRMRAPEAPREIKHLEGVDSAFGAPIGWVTSKLKTDEWQWVKGYSRKFRAGYHELQMDRWPPGVDLEALALSAEKKWAPPEAAPFAFTRPALAKYGTAATRDLRAASVVGWRKMTFSHLELRGGAARISASTDGGKHWKRVPADGDLSAFPAANDGRERLRFRIELIQGKNAQSPVAGPVVISYVSEKDDLIAIEDPAARFYFARQTGALCGIENRRTGSSLTPLRHPSPLFMVRLKPPGAVPEKEWETMTSLDFACTGIRRRRSLTGRDSVRFSYELKREGGKAKVQLKCAHTGDGELTWTVSVQNHFKRTELVDVTYPVIDRAKVSSRAQDDTLLIDGNYLVPFPASFGRFLYWWPVETAPLMDLHNSREGLTVVAHDRTMRSTGISSMGQERRAVQLSLVKRARIKPGESFHGAPHLVRVHRGDWHAAALAERPWLGRQWKAPDTPLWLEEVDGWVPAGWPMGFFDDMGLFAQQVKARTGFPYIQYWNFQVPGTTWTNPHPNIMNGTPDALRWGIDQVHRAGCRITFYIQGYLFDPEAEGADPDDKIGHVHRRDLWPGFELPRKGFTEKNAKRDPDGQRHQWSEHEVEMCYASDGFQEYKHHWALDIFMKNLGADGIYWDSLSKGVTCWAKNHGHGDDPGTWGIEALKNHRQIRQEARKMNPLAIFALEGPPSDTLGQVVDIHLDNAPSLQVVRMLFPKMLIYLGSSDGADRSRRKSFLYGCRFDGIDAKPDQRALLRIRRAIAQYLYPSTPMDTLGIAVPEDTGLKVRRFLCDPARTRGQVLTILNEKKTKDAQVSIQLTRGEPVRTVLTIDAEGKENEIPFRVNEEKRTVTFRTPNTFASAALILSEAEPRVSVGALSNFPRGGKSCVAVKLESLTGQSQEGTVRLVTPKGFRSGSKSFAVSGWGEEAVSVTLEVRASDSAPLGLTDFPVEVRTKGQAKFRRIASAYVEEPVRVLPRWSSANQLRITVENSSLKPRKGQLSFQVESDEVRARSPGRQALSYALEPGEKRAFEFGLEGGERTNSFWAIRGEVTCGRRSWPLYHPFRPVILNGGFENHRFRKDIPDYWWGTFVDRRPALFGRGEYRVTDRAGAAEGKWCLELKGKASEWRAVNHDISLKPNTRYRFHVQIRRTVNSPRIYASIYESRRGPDGKVIGISHIAGKQSAGPLNQWQTFETTFTSLPLDEKVGARVYFYLMNTGGTAWFDDVRLVPEESEHK